MLMRGDMNRIIDNVNKVLEGAFKRIEVLEERLDALGGETPAAKNESEETLVAETPTRRTTKAK